MVCPIVILYGYLSSNYPADRRGIDKLCVSDGSPSRSPRQSTRRDGQSDRIRAASKHQGPGFAPIYGVRPEGSSQVCRRIPSYPSELIVHAN